uniref:Fibronectin type III domain-containing protein 1 isoform X2 n=1 Tax=Geotrypetes seraphini TaxID=260995 RepID=A0A6P8R5T0_GEOSA|nr:fibronectin type III domain-containing protein 1 isoform X2 [Geotrypetes seraphini]
MFAETKTPNRTPRSQLMGFNRSRRLRGSLGNKDRILKMNQAPAQHHDRSPKVKHVASESVHVVSLPSMNKHGQSQPVQRAPVTKRKIPVIPVIPEEEDIPKPKDITVRVISSQSVLVSWVDPILEKTKKIESDRLYTVRYREKGEAARWDYKDTTNRRVLVDDLIPDTMYEFSLRISKGQREGPWTVSVFQRTPESAPTRAPENFDVWPLNSMKTAVRATWDQLPESHGKIKEYIISYAPALKPFGGKSITYRGDDTSVVINDLQPGERYIFKIRAANRRGQGPLSKALTVVMPADETEDLNIHQQTFIQDNLESKKPKNTLLPSPSQASSIPSPEPPLQPSIKHSMKNTKNPMSIFNNKLSTRDDNTKSQPPYKTGHKKLYAQSTEVTEDDELSTETPTTLPITSNPPQKRVMQPSLNNRPPHSVLSSGRTPVRTRPFSLTRKTGIHNHASSSASASVPQEVDSKIKSHSKDNSNIPSFSRIRLGKLPTEGINKDSLENAEEEERNVVSSSNYPVPTQEHSESSKESHFDLYSKQIDSGSITKAEPSKPQSKLVSHKVIPSHREKLQTPSSEHTISKQKSSSPSSEFKITNIKESKHLQPTVSSKVHPSISSHIMPNKINGPSSNNEKEAQVSEEKSTHLAIKATSIPSFVGKSAYDMLEYFRRRISQIDAISGRKRPVSKKFRSQTPPSSTDISSSEFSQPDLNQQDSKKDGPEPSILPLSTTTYSRQNIGSQDNTDDNHYNRETGDTFSKSGQFMPSKRITVTGDTHHSSSEKLHSRSRVPSRMGLHNRPKFSLPQPTPSRIDYPPKRSPMSLAKSFKSDDNNDDYDDNNYGENSPPKIDERPTSSVSRLPSFSASGANKRQNLNIDNGKVKQREPFSRKIAGNKGQDEETLSAPPISNKYFPSHSRVPSSANSRASQLPRLLTRTTVPSTTLSPWYSTKTSLHLYPPLSRQTLFSTPKPSFVQPVSSTRASSFSSTTSRLQTQGSRLRSPFHRSLVRHPQRQGKNGRPNQTTKMEVNGKVLPKSNGSGQRIINGTQGTKWIVDLDRGVVLNLEGQYLQDSLGKPLRVKLGGDGRTIVDQQGTPVVSPDGLPLFGNGRSSGPVANAPDKPVLSLGGKPLIGLEVITTTRRPTTTKRPTTTPTTTTSTTTTTTRRTTTVSTTPEPTTTEELLMPTCPPDSYLQYDEEGNLIMGSDDLPACYTEESYSGPGTDAIMTETTEDLEDYEIVETTVPSTTVLWTTKPSISEEKPDNRPFNSIPVTDLDAAGKKRFTAPYVTYISKDPAAPCSLTEALEHFQVESLEDIIPTDLRGFDLPPQKISYNLTVVAVEGCHSFVILDWAKPGKGDYITGYLVYSASYDDFIKNKWSTQTIGTTNLPIENLKPNTRYYFKIQAKNPHGYGPVSPSLAFVTESDNPSLIVRPPGGEPIWIPFTFKYDPTYTDCSGKQYVKRTWYRKFVGVVLCNSLRYKIYLSDDLKDTFYSIGDSWGRGEDHCQFVDSHLDGRTGPQLDIETLPPIKGYHRQYRQQPVMFGHIGYGSPFYYVGWYECGVPIPGKW